MNAVGVALTIRTLGAFDVLDAQGRSIFAASPRAGQPLLKLLLSSEGFSLASERAAEILWPDSENEVAGQGNVRKAVFNLRKALEPAGAAGVIDARGGRIALDAERCDIDVARFFASPLASNATVEEAAAHLRAFAGTFLPNDMSAEWTARRRAAVAARSITDACLSLRIAAATPDSAAAIEIETIADRLVRASLDDDRLALALARYHLASGRRVAALAVIDRYAEASGDDGAAVAAARQSIVENRTIDAVQRATAFAAIGRDAERAFALAQFDRLHEGRGAAIAITGPPGIGSSVLAHDVARALANRTNARTIDAGEIATIDDLANALQAFLAREPDVAAGVLPGVAATLARAIPALGVRADAAIAPALPGEPRFTLALERAFGQSAGRAPLILVAGVTHAQGAALEAIVKVAATSASAPLAVILTARSFGFDVLQRDALAGHAAILELEPLARADAYDLLAAKGADATDEPAALVAAVGTHPGALSHLLSRPDRTLDPAYALDYLAALERELPPPGLAAFAALCAKRGPAAIEPRWLWLFRSRAIVAGEDEPAIVDDLLVRALELRGDRERDVRAPGDAVRAEIEVSFARARTLAREGRLRTALALLEADDDDAVLAGLWDRAARIAAERARTYALLEETEREGRALAYARARARRSGACDVLEEVALTAAETARWSGDDERAFMEVTNAGTGLAAATLLVRVAAPDDPLAARARATLDAALADPHTHPQAAAAALLAIAASAPEPREALDAARGAAELLPRLPPDTESLACAIDVAAFYALRRERAAAAAAMRIVRERAARLDVPLLQTRVRALVASGVR